jgi:hypothetical protein
VSEYPLPAPAAAAVAFDAHRGRAAVACLNGDIICLRSGAAAAVLQQQAAPQQAAARPVKRRRLADLGEQAARKPAAPQVLLLAGASGSGPEHDAVACAGGASSIHADAAASFAACAAASLATPVFGRPAVDAATGITVCASVVGEVVALSGGEDCVVQSDARCFVSVLLMQRWGQRSCSTRPEIQIVVPLQTSSRSGPHTWGRRSMRRSACCSRHRITQTPSRTAAAAGPAAAAAVPRTWRKAPAMAAAAGRQARKLEAARWRWRPTRRGGSAGCACAAAACCGRLTSGRLAIRSVAAPVAAAVAQLCRSGPA